MAQTFIATSAFYITLVATLSIPFATGFYAIEFPGDALGFKGWAVDYDMSIYAKVKLLSVFGSIGFLGFFVRFFLKRADVRLVFPWLFALVIILALSTYFSKYPLIALIGFPNHYEGGLTFASYVGVFLLTYIGTWNLKRLTLLATSLCISICILAVLLYLETRDLPFFLIWPFTRLFDANHVDLNYHTAIRGATLYNSNYLAHYAVTTVPVFIMLGLKKSNGVIRWISFVGTACCVWVIILTHSRAAMLASVVVAIYALGQIKFSRKQRGILGLSIFLVLSSFFVINKNSIKRMGMDFLGTSIHKQAPFKSVITEKNYLKIKTDTFDLLFRITDGHLQVFNEKNQNILKSIDHSQLIFLDPHTVNANIRIEEFDRAPLLVIHYSGAVIEAAFQNNQFWIRELNALYKTAPIKTLNFLPEHAFSGRGFIWTRTIPLLSDQWLIGHGLDTLPMYFPQRDYAGKLNAFGKSYVLVDKPHNVFLMLVFSLGLTGAGLLLIPLVRIVYRGLKTQDIVLQSTSLAVLSYLVAGIFTDSTVGVTSLFAILVGVNASASNSEKVKPSSATAND